MYKIQCLFLRMGVVRAQVVTAGAIAPPTLAWWMQQHSKIVPKPSLRKSCSEQRPCPFLTLWDPSSIKKRLGGLERWKDRDGRVVSLYFETGVLCVTLAVPELIM